MDLLRWFSEYARDGKMTERRDLTRLFRFPVEDGIPTPAHAEGFRSFLREHGIDRDHAESCEKCRYAEDRVGDLYMMALALNAISTDDERDGDEIGTANRVLLRLPSEDADAGRAAPAPPEPEPSQREAVKQRILEQIDQGFPTRNIAVMNGVTVRWVQMVRAERDGHGRDRRRKR